jgi:glycosyltransferase involved in cell wall biosynthesis
MRVAHLSPSMPPIIGGTEGYVATLSSSLKKLGVSSEIIALCDTRKWKGTRNVKERWIDGTRALVWPSYPMGVLNMATGHLIGAHFIPAVVDELERHLETFDLLHFHDEVDLSLPISLMRLKKQKLLTLHTSFTTLPFYRANPIARKMLTESAMLFHVFSIHEKDSLIDLGVDEQEIRVVPHGVNVHEFQPRTTELNERRVRIGCVCRIERPKGVIDLLAAAKILRERFPAGRFEIRIVGPVTDVRYYRELLEYTKRTNLKEVTFSGALDGRRMAHFLQECSIFSLPSLAGPASIVNLEAMACGLPVVAVGLEGISEVEDGETGFLIPPNDPKNLAEKLATLIGDEMLRKEMGRKGRRRAESLFSTERTTRMIVDVYRELEQMRVTSSKS